MVTKSLPNLRKVGIARLMISKEKDNIGHRQRLRTRFLKDNGESMPDYEILELLLMNAMPRKDVKPLAKALLKEYKTYADLIQTDKEILLQFPGCSHAAVSVLKLAEASALRLLKGKITGRHILDNWMKVLDYCQALLARAKAEQLRILFLNRGNSLMYDELWYEGTIDEAPFYAREIVKRTLDLGAGAIILVHNHPSGKAEASRQDIDATLELKRALDVLDIKLHDHVIITHDSYYSMRSKGIFS